MASLDNSSNNRVKDLYELVYATLLHDIGKPFTRAGEKKPHEFIGADIVSRYSSLFQRIGLSSEKISELIRFHHYELRNIKPSIEIMELLELLKKADKESALERSLGDEALGATKASMIRYFVSPLWIIDYYRRVLSGKKLDFDDYIRKIIFNENTMICYDPVPLARLSKFMELDVVRKELISKECVDRENYIRRYELVKKTLVDHLDILLKISLSGFFNKDTLLETIKSIIRYLFIFVPDALYGVQIPSTNLSSHSIISSALASSYVLGGELIRLATIDISGIQSFISSYAKRKGVLRQLRGRSLLLQLLVRAISYKVLKELGLPSIHLVLERGDNVLFILPNTNDVLKKFNKVVKEIEKSIYDIFHGDLYIITAISQPFKPEYQEPWDKDFGEKGFSKAFKELGYLINYLKFRKFSNLEPNYLETHVIRSNSDDRVPAMCSFCKTTTFSNNLIKLSKKFKEALLIEDTEELCPACLLAHVLGSKSSNIVFVVEIRSKEITDCLYNKLISQDNKFIEIIDLAAIAPLKGLDVTYLIISYKGEVKSSVDEWKILMYVLKEFFNYVNRSCNIRSSVDVIIMKNNDPGHMLPEKTYLEEFLADMKDIVSHIPVDVKIGFSSIFVNFTTGLIKDLEDLARVNDEETLISWIKIDGDRIGEKGLYFIGSIGRYVTFSELVNFFTNMCGYLIMNGNAMVMQGNSIKRSRIGDRTVVIFSGGDDSFIVSRFIEGIYYVNYYGKWFREFFGKLAGNPILTVSAGYIIRKSHYPVSLSYNEVIKALSVAKVEGRDRVLVEPLTPKASIYESLRDMSVDWSLLDKVLDLTTNVEVLNPIIKGDISKQILYKLFEISSSIQELYARQVSSKEEFEKRLLEQLINYIYLYNRYSVLNKYFKEFIETVFSRLSLEKPLEPQTIVSLLENNKYDDIIKGFNVLQKYLSLQLLRLREKL